MGSKEEVMLTRQATATLDWDRSVVASLLQEHAIRTRCMAFRYMYAVQPGHCYRWFLHGCLLSVFIKEEGSFSYIACNVTRRLLFLSQTRKICPIYMTYVSRYPAYRAVTGVSERRGWDRMDGREMKGAWGGLELVGFRCLSGLRCQPWDMYSQS